MASKVHLVHRSQPFLNCPSSSKDFNLTSSRGIKCCKRLGRFDVFKKLNIAPVCCTFSCWSQCFHRQADHWRGRIACFQQFWRAFPRHKTHTFLYLGFGFFLHAFVKTPSPTKTRPAGKRLDYSLSRTPHLVHQGVVLRCQSSFPPGQFVGHLPQNSLHRNMFEVRHGILLQQFQIQLLMLLKAACDSIHVQAVPRSTHHASFVIWSYLESKFWTSPDIHSKLFYPHHMLNCLQWTVHCHKLPSVRSCYDSWRQGTPAYQKIAKICSKIIWLGYFWVKRTFSNLSTEFDQERRLGCNWHLCWPCLMSAREAGTLVQRANTSLASYLSSCTNTTHSIFLFHHLRLQP